MERIRRPAHARSVTYALRRSQRRLHCVSTAEHRVRAVPRRQARLPCRARPGACELAPLLPESQAASVRRRVLIDTALQEPVLSSGRGPDRRTIKCGLGRADRTTEDDQHGPDTPELQPVVSIIGERINEAPPAVEHVVLRGENVASESMNVWPSVISPPRASRSRRLIASLTPPLRDRESDPTRRGREPSRSQPNGAPPRSMEAGPRVPAIARQPGVPGVNAGRRNARRDRVRCPGGSCASCCWGAGLCVAGCWRP
jgi:hypothetical protein